MYLQDTAYAAILCCCCAESGVLEQRMDLELNSEDCHAWHCIAYAGTA